MSDEPTVLYALGDGVATITLNRPEVFNAFNQRLHSELLRALKEAERDQGVRCIVITGAGKGFCSGQDLKELPAEGSGSIIQSVRERYNPLILKLRSIPKPIVAAVNGVAAGAGMSLALACDFRVAVDTARFVAAFVKIGLVPDSGMSYFLPRLIGPARALELCMLGGTIKAPTAHSYGLLSAIAGAEEFPATVAAFAQQLVSGPVTTLGLMKRSFELAHGATLEQVLDYEAQAQQIASESPDHAEGILAFRDKRLAKFR